MLILNSEEESDINQNTENPSEQKTTTEDAYADRASLTWSSIPGVLNPKFTSPTSLPLYFYFGYQLLQESDLLQKFGHVCG